MTKDHCNFTFECVKLFSGFDGRECKIYPRLIVTERNAFLTYGMLLLSGSDVFHDTYFARSVDGGKTFDEPRKLERLEARKDGIRTIFSPATEYYSKYYKKWFVNTL